jgi:hypothetical protein
VHEALVGLAVLLLTYNAREDDDFDERMEAFLTDVRAAYDWHPTEDRRGTEH